VLYGYSRSHDGKAVDKLLQDYKGCLVADAHSVCEQLYQTGDGDGAARLRSDAEGVVIESLRSMLDAA
jgi:hypothetical protein